MSMLAVNDSLDFNSIKEYLEITDGNLASHIKALEKEKFVGVEKTFVGRKPNTRYYITNLGREAFKQHLNTLEKFVKAGKDNI